MPVRWNEKQQRFDEHPTKPPRKIATSFRLSEEALAIIREMSKALGISQADVVEMAVRQLEAKLPPQ